MIQGSRIGGLMMGKHLYWLSDAEWAKIEPLLPRGCRGAHRVDDRRVISGIIHMLKTGARWRDCPAAYGPYTTIYNRYHRWSLQGVWFAIFEALTGSSGSTGGQRSRPPTSRRTAPQPGQKGGLRASDRSLARRPHHQDPRSDRRERPAARAVAHARQHQRRHYGGSLDRRSRRSNPPAGRRPGLRCHV